MSNFDFDAAFAAFGSKKPISLSSAPPLPKLVSSCPQPNPLPPSSSLSVESITKLLTLKSFEGNTKKKGLYEIFMRFLLMVVLYIT